MDEVFGIPLELLIAVVINFILVIIIFIMALSNRSRIKKLKARYEKFMRGLSDRNIEQLIDDCIDSVKYVNEKNKEIENQINRIERNLLHCIQKIGIVRFNAFDDVGSDLSFSVALLDCNDNGVVLSGLYARENSTTYAKPIVAGKSSYPLSVEEIKAIDIARKTFREYPYFKGMKEDN